MTSNFNALLIKEINILRTNPKKYAEKVQNFTKYFKGKVLRIPGTNSGIRTEEGVDAYNEAVTFLNKQKSIDPLQPSKGMCKIAEDLLHEIQNRDPGDLNNIDMETIISKYGNFCGNFARAIDFGGENAENVVVNLLVSDGDKSRSQRQTLLSTDLKCFGVANGKHNYYRYCSVIVSCTKFENTVDKNDDCEFDIKNLDDDKNNLNKSKKKVEDKINVDQLPEGCISVNKSEKIVVENGVKKKIIRITRMMDDGTKEVETVKEAVDE